MRIHILVKRNALTDTAIVWAVDELLNPTISALLDEINEVIPLESGSEWGLEDYSVELRTSKGNYELLHWQNVNTLLKDEDEVLVRPLTSREIKQRRDAGRSQVTQDGRRIIDGIPFGGTKRKMIANRPPVVIPTRKRVRLTYDEEDEKERTAPALMLTQFPHNGASVGVGWKREKKARFEEPELKKDQDDEEEDSEEDEDFEPPGDDDDEDDLDLSELDDELKGLLEEAGSSDKENTAAKLSQETTTSPSNKENIPIKSRKQNVAPSTINNLMIGTVHPIIKDVVQEFQEAFPQLPGTVLNKMLINPPVDSKLVTVYDALNVGSEAKKSKTSIMNAIWKLLDAEAEHEEKATQSARLTQSAATVATPSKGENKENPEAPGVSGDDDDDEEEDGFDEDFPEEAAKADSGWLPGQIDASGRLLGAGLEKKHVRFEDSGDDELPADGMIDISDDSSSSSDSDPDSEDESVTVSSKKAAAHVLDSDSSSSGTSSSASNSESESDSESDSDRESDSSSSGSDSSSESDSDSDSEPEQQSSKAQPTPLPLSAQTAPPASAGSVSNPARTTTPPGAGLSRTKARNERRRKQNVLQRLQKKGILPAGTTLTEFMKLDTVNDNTSPEAAANVLAAIRKEHGGEERAEKKKQTKEAKQAALEAERQRMIAQLYSGGIDVNPTAPEPKFIEEAVESVKSKKERKANSVANRLIFAALGQKVPKNKEEADAISKKLMTGVTPIVVKPTGLEAVAESADTIGDSWRGNIPIYRAVESKHRGEVFNEPSFPFVQKSYIPDTSALHPLNFRKGKKGKNKKMVREGEQEFEKGESYYQEEEQPSHKKHKRMHGDEDNFDNNVDNTVLNYDEADEDPNDQLMQGSQEQEEVEDLIALPEDPVELPAVKPEEMKTGMVVAFKELTISEETGWQPVISDWRTAVVISVDEGLKAVTIVLAVRDREVRSYDEETGERIHGKFDMPVDDDENEAEDDGVRTKEFGEFMESRLVQAPEETMEFKPAEIVQDAEDAEDDTAMDANPDKDDEVITEPANADADDSPTLDQTEDQEMMAFIQNKAAADQDRSQSPQNKERQLQNAAKAVGTKTAHVVAEATNITTVKTSEVAAVTTGNNANEIIEQLQQVMDGEMEALGAPAKEAQRAPQVDEPTNPLPPHAEFSPKFHGLGSMIDNTDKSQPFIVSRSSPMQGALDGNHSTENSAPKSFILEGSQIAELNGPLSNSEATAASAPVSSADADGINDAPTLQGDEELVEPPRSSQRWTQDSRSTKQSNSASRPGSAVGSQSVEVAKSDLFLVSRPSSVAQKSLSPERPSRDISASASSQPPSPPQMSYSQSNWQSAHLAPNLTVSQRREPENKENEFRQSFSHSQGRKHTKSLPPPAKDFMSLKERLKAASPRKKVKISAKILSKRTKSLRSAEEEVTSALTAAQAPQENNESTVQKPDSEDGGPSISQCEEANVMFISKNKKSPPCRATRMTRSKKDYQSMPNLRRNQNESSPFQPPIGSQIFDLTVTDDEEDGTEAMENDSDLQGEAVHILTANDGVPGGFADRKRLHKMKNIRERRKLKQAKSNK